MTTTENQINVRDGVYKGRSYEVTVTPGHNMFRVEYVDIEGLPRVKGSGTGWVTTLEGAIAAGHTMARDVIDG